MAGSPGDGGRAARARSRAHGLGLADGQPQQRRTTRRWTGAASWSATLAGLPLHLAFWDKGTDGQAFMRFYDSTNPEARRYVWEKVTDGYRRYGIRAFWLDACEPEILADNPEAARYFMGEGSEVQGIYPREHARGFYEGLRASGEDDVLLLCRSAWAGSQRYGAAVWSGDIESTFEALAAQVPAGLNMGISGIPWWTTDIGGFRNGDPTTAYFRELVVRWFQFGAFCPLFRLHGVREPGPLVGSGQTGAPNEVWSFGDEAYGLIREQLALRERIRPYVMDADGHGQRHRAPAHARALPGVPGRGTGVGGERPVHVRPGRAGRPGDGARSAGTRLYLPVGASWLDAWTGEPVKKNGWVTADAPLERIPVYLREGGALERPVAQRNMKTQAGAAATTGAGAAVRSAGTGSQAVCSEEAAARGVALPGPCDRVFALRIRPARRLQRDVELRADLSRDDRQFHRPVRRARQLPLRLS